MAINSIQSSNAMRDLAVQITKQMDKDGDGKLSTTEFTNFLSSFFNSAKLASATAATNTAASAPAPTATTATTSAMANIGAVAAAASDIPSRAAVGTMAGFDYYKMIDKSVTTTKYTIGRILQGFPNTPEGLRQALPDLQKVVPGVKIVGGDKGDKLDFGGYVNKEGQKIGVIDVIEAATETSGKAWQWLPVE